jgi:hypothetical protein
MSKILLFRGSPRSNIPEVEEWNIKLPCDVLCVRYMAEIPAYWWARDYFLTHGYDYLAIATDDIVVKPEHIEQLQEDVDGNDFEVISGYMNVDENHWPNGYMNISYDLALQDRKLRYYNWILPGDLPESDIFRVKFAGFGLTAIRRDIMELLQFAGDGYYKGHGMKFGASLDLVFAWDCHDHKIPIYCDKRIKMQHLRTHGQHQIGQHNPRAFLYKDGEEIALGRPENISPQRTYV